MLPWKREEALVEMTDLSKLAGELVAMFDRLAAEHGHKKAAKYMACGISAVLGHMANTSPESDRRLMVQDLLDVERERWVSYLTRPDDEIIQIHTGNSKAEAEGPIKDRVDKSGMREGHFTLRTRPPLETH
jgi:hypothetical protein